MLFPSERQVAMIAPRAGAGDVVELVGAPEVLAAVAAQLILDLGKHLNSN
jgi:hypothetical protein